VSSKDEASVAVADATLVASRALLGVIARSVAGALEDVTLPQFRVLVLLSSGGPLRTGVLADRLGVNPSTFSRSLDRMVAGGWVDRLPNPDSRREVIIDLTHAGRRLVATVSERRRGEYRTILSRLSPQEQESILHAMELFNAAAGESSVEDLLTLGL
jgi:DNA-binding MarR family transcriptional regulator